jgi:hypothetical protein
LAERHSSQSINEEQDMNSTAVAVSARRSPRSVNGDPGVRVGDREREKVITRLGQAFTQGYLSIPEYETRLDQALQAQTAGALNQLLGDLPVGRIAQSDPRRRAARVAAARRGVRIHFAAYLAAALLMIGIWLIVAVTVGAWYFWPVWPILGWGIGVISHAVPARQLGALPSCIGLSRWTADPAMSSCCVYDMVNRIEPMVLHRRALLGSALAGLVAVAAGCGVRLRLAAPSTASNSVAPAMSALAQLERQFDGRLGVCAIDTGSGVSVSYRAEERFLMCSTAKVLSVAAIQHLASGQPGLLDRLIEYAQSDILKWAPVTSQHVADGMSVAALCDAAITMSDNTAANLLVELPGGPQKVTAFARSIGDQVTSVDRLEPELNVGAPDDTETPRRRPRWRQTCTLLSSAVDSPTTPVIG